MYFTLKGYLFILIYLFLSSYMKTKTKNVKISDKHHEMLKVHCEKNGLKMYKLLEKWIEDYIKPKKKDIYGES